MKTLSKSESKLISSLNLKKYRQKYNKFIVEGYKNIKELITFYPERVDLLVSDNSEFLKELVAETSVNPESCRWVSSTDFKRISNLVSPQPILAVSGYSVSQVSFNKDSGWVVYLDGLQDPGNVGTIIRTADWFGIGTIVFSKGCVDPYNPKVVQATMGSIFRMNFMFSELSEVRKMSGEEDIWGADLEGQDLYSIEFKKSGILCVGNEGEGLSEEIKKQCTNKVFIQRGGIGTTTGAESLNVAIATGIILSRIKK